ncbi:MAG: polymer-forming cytoskeletal protein [Paludibacteraceae bacterium]|nr:polymer-forming cytoskeletal protein [Paludibacteraceae bacterium]MEE3484430.1 polymer-forming cytoskeletal protein [Bacteroidales bacterium]
MSKEIIGNGHNTLALGTKITGDIVAKSDFRLDGTIEGTIVCEGKMVIGEKGVMIGTLTCANAEIEGTVKGTMHISQTLSLKSTAVVEGDIDTKILSIEPRAIFTGSCDMSNAESAPAKDKEKEK